MNGKNIFYQYIDKYTDKSVTKLKEHVTRVVKMCEKFSEKLDLNGERKALLIDAAWLHDIAKFNNKKQHNEEKYIRAAVIKVSEDKELSAICAIIKAHKGDFEPCKEYELEAAILRICDKLDKFKKGQDDAYKKCRESMEEIKEKIPELPIEFEKTYNSFMKQEGYYL